MQENQRRPKRKKSRMDQRMIVKRHLLKILRKAEPITCQDSSKTMKRLYCQIYISKRSLRLRRRKKPHLLSRKSQWNISFSAF
jgi:hypothetical protein